jgi:hypothetical protein
LKIRIDVTHYQATPIPLLGLFEGEKRAVSSWERRYL